MWFVNIRIFPVPFAPVVSLERGFVGPRAALDQMLQTFRPFPYSLSGIREGNIRDILGYSSPSSSTESNIRSAKTLFQFATVRHFLCGAYLSARFKRGKRLSRFGDNCTNYFSTLPIEDSLRRLWCSILDVGVCVYQLINFLEKGG
jgi:hypothetical protein